MPYGREAESRTLALLDSALLEARARPVPDAVVRQLQTAAPKDVEELLAPLQARGEEYAKDAKDRLEKRAEVEAKAMLEILETQKKHLQETVARHERPEAQLKFREFNEEEQRQLEANQRYWGKRLAALDNELQTEPERIHGVYKVCAQRIEPVGLIYLWPVTGKKWRRTPQFSITRNGWATCSRSGSWFRSRRFWT